MDASDDMEDMFVTPDVRARRRRLHTEAEQRRRDAIKRGFDNLLELIHPVKADPGSSLIRMSKATILNRCSCVASNCTASDKRPQAMVLRRWACVSSLDAA
nr:unnamed protein product [Spirometra erinaceieuropaei]